MAGLDWCRATISRPARGAVVVCDMLSRWRDMKEEHAEVR